MVCVVERYLPGISRAGLLPRLSRLQPVTDRLRCVGSAVRYLGSTIVLEDEACFCQFDGPPQAAVAEANHRADLPIDRIVPALLVQPNYTSSEMSVSASGSKRAGLRPSSIGGRDLQRPPIRSHPRSTTVEATHTRRTYRGLPSTDRAPRNAADAALGTRALP